MIEKLGGISLCLALIIFLSCNKASDFGSFLDDGSALPVEFDEIPLIAHTIRGEPVLSWSEFIRYNSHVAGTLDDPIFGKTRAELYWQYNLAIPPDFTAGILDSMVLSVGYDTSAVGYGTFDIPQDFEIHRIQEFMSRTEDHFTDRIFATDAEPIGVIAQVVPNDDTTFVQEPRGLDVVTNIYGPQLRIKLNDDFGNEFINYGDTIFDSNISFQEKFMGVKLSSASETGGIVNFEVFGPETRLNVYFTANDTMGQYNMALSSQSVIHNHFTNDISGTLVEEFINEGRLDDSLLFVQGHGGPAVELSIPDLSQLQGSTINSAIMEITVATLSPSDTIQFPPIKQLGLFELTDAGERIQIKDLADVFGGNALTLFFGGDLDYDAEEGIYSYSMNISQHLQKMVDGEVGNALILSTLQPVSEASRSILYGPSHSKFGAKLRVTHTKL